MLVLNGLRKDREDTTIRLQPDPVDFGVVGN